MATDVVHLDAKCQTCARNNLTHGQNLQILPNVRSLMFVTMNIVRHFPEMTPLTQFVVLIMNYELFSNLLPAISTTKANSTHNESTFLSTGSCRAVCLHIIFCARANKKQHIAPLYIYL